MAVTFNGFQNGLRWLIILIDCTVIAGCSSDFNPNLGTEGIPVVYGLINPEERVYNISVTKTFLCDQNGIDCSKSQDIQYYKDVKVELSVMTAEGLLINKAELHPVTIERERSVDGTFGTSSKVIYSITRDEILTGSDFDQKRTLVLNISTPEYPKTVTAQSNIRHIHKLISPPEWLHGMKMDYFSEFNESIRWSGFQDDYYEVTLKFIYSNVYENSSSLGNVELGFNVPQVANTDNSQMEFAYRIYGDLFLQKIAKSFRDTEMPDSLKYRKFQTFDVQVTSTTTDYYNYIYALKLDSDFPVAQKSNIVNGLGVFATKRVVRSIGHILTENVLDSLANSKITKALKFVKW